MKVDMSPQAVTARLKLLDQLWELSVKLRQVRHGEEPRIEKSETALLSEGSLVEDWTSPEENKAWRHLADLPSR